MFYVLTTFRGGYKLERDNLLHLWVVNRQLLLIIVYKIRLALKINYLRRKNILKSKTKRFRR